MDGLKGKQVAVAASRRAKAIDTLISKHGGNTIQLPIQGEYQLNDSICQQDVKKLVENTFDFVILTTGIGAETLEQSAKRLHIHTSFIDKLKSSTLAIRGSKTTKWMKQHHLDTKHSFCRWNNGKFVCIFTSCQTGRRKTNLFADI